MKVNSKMVLIAFCPVARTKSIIPIDPALGASFWRRHYDGGGQDEGVDSAPPLHRISTSGTPSKHGARTELA